jgi:hypothetical protein
LQVSLQQLSEQLGRLLDVQLHLQMPHQFLLNSLLQL